MNTFLNRKLLLNIKKIIVVYNNVFLKFLGYDIYCSASGMFVERRVDTFNVCVRRMEYSFRERI